MMQHTPTTKATDILSRRYSTSPERVASVETERFRAIAARYMHHLMRETRYATKAGPYKSRSRPSCASFNPSCKRRINS